MLGGGCTVWSAVCTCKFMKAVVLKLYKLLFWTQEEHLLSWLWHMMPQFLLKCVCVLRFPLCSLPCMFCLVLSVTVYERWSGRAQTLITASSKSDWACKEIVDHCIERSSGHIFLIRLCKHSKRQFSITLPSKVKPSFLIILESSCIDKHEDKDVRNHPNTCILRICNKSCFPVRFYSFHPPQKNPPGRNPPPRS